MKTKQGICVVIRGSALISKLLLLCFLARWVSAAEVGIYGVLCATVIIALQLVGFDFYAFNTREILKVTPEKQVVYIKNQLVVHLISYLVFFPLMLFLFIFHVLSWSLIGWFYLILILEHFSQEANRLLITLGKPVAANVAMFFRAGIWVYFLLFIVFVLKRHINLNYVWFCWAVGDLMAIIFIFYKFMFLPWSKTWKSVIDWRWIRMGIRISIVFLLSTACLQLLTYLGRYFLQYMLDLKSVGIFVFYSNLLGAILTFAQVAIYNFLVPPMIKNYYEDHLTLLPALKKMYLIIITYLIVIGVGASIGIFAVLYFVKQPIYSHYLWLFYILLFATLANVMGQVPHYALYVVHKEKWLLHVTWMALVISVAFNFVLIKMMGIYGAGYAVLLTMLFIWFSKYVLFRMYFRERRCLS